MVIDVLQFKIFVHNIKYLYSCEFITNFIKIMIVNIKVVSFIYNNSSP